MGRKITVIVALLLLYNISQAADTLRIMHYNLMQYSLNASGCMHDLSAKDNALRTILNYVQPDILTVNEVGKDVKYTQRILDNCLNVNGVNSWVHGKLTSVSGGEASLFSNMIFYNKDKFTMHSSYCIPNAVRDFNVYKLYANSTNLRGGDTSFIVVIVGHLKAGESDSVKRAEQVSALMTRLKKIGRADNYIFCGDMNVNSSGERAYQLMVNNENANIRFYDPINKPGEWHDNPYYASIHTQSTHDTYGGCYSAGGLDDRFDFILVSQSVLKGTRHVKALPHTYKAIGQDGKHLNASILSGNHSESHNLITALSIMSDHLPIMMDVIIQNSHAEYAMVNGDKNMEREMQSVSVKNPIDSHVEFSLYDRQPRIYEVEILSLFGQVMYYTQVQTDVGNNEYKIKVPRLMSGIYCLRLTCNGVHTIRKIIKK